MRLVKPTTHVEDSGDQTLRNPRRLRVGKPQWLKDWIADQGRYVLLECGHKVNLNERAIVIIERAIGNIDVICHRCKRIEPVKRHMKVLEYLDIKAAEIPDEPLF